MAPKKQKKPAVKKATKVKKPAKKIPPKKKATIKKAARASRAAPVTMSRPAGIPCICIQKRKRWFCMRKLPDGSLIQCDGPFASQEICEQHVCI